MIRKLRTHDAKHMYEWMKDDVVVHFLDTDFSSKTLKDCEDFINNSTNDNNKHFAIVDDKDEYMGTVSLKNIDYNNRIAEMAITIRKCAMGNGYSKKALDDIFDYGRNELGITRFYWYVNPNNTRALNFYDKHNYTKINYIDVFGKLDDKYVWYLLNIG